MSRWRPVLLTAAWTSETSPLDPRPARPSSYGRIVTSDGDHEQPGDDVQPGRHARQAGPRPDRVDDGRDDDEAPGDELRAVVEADARSAPLATWPNATNATTTAVATIAPRATLRNTSARTAQDEPRRRRRSGRAAARRRPAGPRRGSPRTGTGPAYAAKQQRVDRDARRAPTTARIDRSDLRVRTTRGRPLDRPCGLGPSRAEDRRAGGSTAALPRGRAVGCCMHRRPPQLCRPWLRQLRPPGAARRAIASRARTLTNERAAAARPLGEHALRDPRTSTAIADARTHGQEVLSASAGAEAPLAAGQRAAVRGARRRRRRGPPLPADHARRPLHRDPRRRERPVRPAAADRARSAVLAAPVSAWLAWGRATAWLGAIDASLGRRARRPARRGRGRGPPAGVAQLGRRDAAGRAAAHRRRQRVPAERPARLRPRRPRRCDGPPLSPVAAPPPAAVSVTDPDAAPLEEP